MKVLSVQMLVLLEPLLSEVVPCQVGASENVCASISIFVQFDMDSLCCHFVLCKYIKHQPNICPKKGFSIDFNVILISN